jgi:hypothetical protein
MNSIPGALWWSIAVWGAAGAWWVIFPDAVARFYGLLGVRFYSRIGPRGIRALGVVFLIISGFLAAMALLALIT